MLHIILSVAQFIFAVAAVYVAWWAMQRGLVVAALAATITVLVFLAFSYALHLVSEVYLPLEILIEGYYVDHIFALVGFLTFIWLMVRGSRVKQ